MKKKQQPATTTASKKNTKQKQPKPTIEYASEEVIEVLFQFFKIYHLALSKIGKSKSYHREAHFEQDFIHRTYQGTCAHVL